MRAVLVFCEGVHDTTFTSRCLGAVAAGKWIGKTINELPSPLGPLKDPRNPLRPIAESLIAHRYHRPHIGDLKLRSAAHADPPTFESIIHVALDDTYYCLIQCHGDSAAASATHLVDDMASQIDLQLPFDIHEFAAAFLFDADDAVTARETRFATDYTPGLLAPGDAPRHATWVRRGVRGRPVGLFVFHDAQTRAGTLEAHLQQLVMAEWPQRWHAAGHYLSAHADPGDPVSTRPADMLKAQICVTGQFRFPGKPMTLVLDRDGLSGRHFTGPDAQALVGFLRGVPW